MPMVYLTENRILLSRLRFIRCQCLLHIRLGKPIIAHGRASFACSLVAQGVDQYDLLVRPDALGKGQPVFSRLAMPRPLKADELEGLSRGLGGADLSRGVKGFPL
jgi:hypothetical protein